MLSAAAARLLLILWRSSRPALPAWPAPPDPEVDGALAAAEPDEEEAVAEEPGEPCVWHAESFSSSHLSSDRRRAFMKKLATVDTSRPSCAAIADCISFVGRFTSCHHSTIQFRMLSLLYSTVFLSYLSGIVQTADCRAQHSSVQYGSREEISARGIAREASCAGCR